MATRTDDELIDLTEDDHPRRHPDRGDDRGRDAEGPGDVPASGWKDVALRVKGEVKEDQVPLLSAGVAFFLLLALFPALAALVSLYGIFADPDQVAQQVRDLTGSLPEDARGLITDQLESITSEQQGIGVTLAVSIAAALWAASSGVKHLIGAVNAAYDERESRGFLKLRGLSLGLTVGAIAFASVAIGVIAVLPTVADQLPFGSLGQTLVQIGSYVGLAVGFALGLAALYRYAPDRDAPRWQWVSWGAVIGTAVWILGSIAFSVYVSNFGSYGETYGSIGAVIVLMLWLVVTAFAVILGAEINSELEAQTARDSTVGEPQPMGRRDAVKADDLGEPVATD
ncbi:YihY/virulence factor BrkB family protein [Acidimicrobiia bacterium EGI L10123]|uniref:YihY/virulence factor BrkB family protein n=1 Tax=Salinilacustrithrix flava TaxID=2957203 RepID=UPI003D7C27A5|nr:YihY/virulence factor BrkB family protein [Acidimicrobiia bacterium EGI L10123]